jgi:type IV pilus assembly protein PilC
VERYRYKALNAMGRPVRGVISAANENDLFAQLRGAGMELVSCKALSQQKGMLLSRAVSSKINVREKIQLFLHLEQMQSAGVPMLDALSDIRETSDNPRMRDIISDVAKSVTEGKALSEALAEHSRVFGNLYTSLIAAGEETGDLPASYRQLIKFLKWMDAMEARIRKATRYPLVLVGVVFVTVFVMMAVVVPQVVDFLVAQKQDLPFYTVALINVSDFFVNWWPIAFSVPVALVIGTAVLRRSSSNVRYWMDVFFLKLPIAGPLIRKINIARFAQTFGALFASGIDVLTGLNAATNTIGNKALVEAMDSVQQYVRSGSSLSQALERSGEFPSMVIRMVRIGEETGKLTEVLDQVCEFYTHDVDEEVQKLISMIEPSLTVLLGGMIMWIAVGVFGPIYSSFESMNF